MKDKNLPNDYNSLSLEELTDVANKMIEDLESKKDLETSIEKYQNLLKLNNIIEKKFQKNIKDINLNRSNIEETIKTKISSIPILKNDTNNVIEFNDSFNEEIKDNKKRSFWDLLKSK